MSMNEDMPQEPRDYTKLIWGGVLLLVGLMVALIWWAGRPDPNISRVRARHILVKFEKSDAAARSRALELVTDLRARLLDGESFGLLAKDYSDDPYSAARGGDLGNYPRGTFAKNFEDYVWTAPIGELSEIIETEFGFHLIEVTDRYVSEADRFEVETERRAIEEQRRERGGGQPAP